MLAAFDWRQLKTGGRTYSFDGKNILIKDEFDVSKEEAVPCYWASPGLLRTKGKPGTVTKLKNSLGVLAGQMELDSRLFLVQSACEARYSSKTECGKDMLSPRTEVGYPGRMGENDLGDTVRDALDSGAHCSFGLTQCLLSTARQVRPDLFKDVARPKHRYVLASPENAFRCLEALVKTFPLDTQQDPLKIRVALGAGGVYSGEGPWGVRLYNDSVLLHWVCFWNDLASIS